MIVEGMENIVLIDETESSRDNMPPLLFGIMEDC